MKKDKIWALFISVCLIISAIPTQAFATSEYIWPTSSHRITQKYSSKHTAIDIGVNAVNVYASRGGKVVKAYRGCSNYSGDGSNRTCIQNGCTSGNIFRDGYCNDDFGNGVIIQHDDGTYAGYAHLSTVSVQRGQRVEQGTLLGVSGSSGKSKGPHLHFYVARGNAWGSGGFYNPETLLNGSVGNTVAPVTPVTPTNSKPGRTSQPTVSVNNNNASVTVNWNSVANATHYDVYLVQEPWGWGDIKYRGSTQGTSYTFTNVRDGKYAAFVIARPNKDTVQSEWRHDVIVKKAIQVTPGRTSQPAVSVNNNNASVAVSWNSVANATSYDVYLVQEPWGWGDIKYRGSTQGTNYTFTNVRDGKYAAFVIARPNKDSVQSEWSSFNVNAAPTSTVDFSNIKASNISETNAKLSASVSYSGKHPSEVGIYLGDSTGSMRKVSSDKINHSKNPFDMWYDLNKHGVTLSAGTQYYYKMYAIVDGKEFTSKTKNFWTSLTISVNSGSEKKNPDPVGMPAVSVDGSTVSVSWNSVANATSYDVYLVQEPWGWGDIKYRGSTHGTSYTFTNVRNGAYAAFVIARPNKDTVQSEWSSFNVNAASTSTADFYNINASNVSQTNAQLNASISYSGNHPSEVGVYFGNSTDSMRKVGSDAINHNKNPFDMWYSLNKYGITLSAGTTYYYKMYAIMDGREVTSNVQSFTTPAQVNSNLVTARVSGTPGGLAINSQPNQYTKIGRMDEGVYCTIDLSRTSGNWYYVTYNGVSGYAYNRYLVIQ